MSMRAAFLSMRPTRLRNVCTFCISRPQGWLHTQSQRPHIRLRLCSHKASDGQRLDPPDVRKLAKMAQIALTEEEIVEFEPQLQQIVEWFGQLQALDVSGVPPAVRIDVGEENVLRADSAVDYDAREALLSAVPEKEGLSVKVPKII